MIFCSLFSHTRKHKCTLFSLVCIFSFPFYPIHLLYVFIYVVESMWYLKLWANYDLLFILFQHNEAQIHSFLIGKCANFFIIKFIYDICLFFCWIHLVLILWANNDLFFFLTQASRYPLFSQFRKML